MSESGLDIDGHPTEVFPDQPITPMVASRAFHERKGIYEFGSSTCNIGHKIPWKFIAHEYDLISYSFLADVDTLIASNANLRLLSVDDQGLVILEDTVTNKVIFVNPVGGIIPLAGNPSIDFNTEFSHAVSVKLTYIGFGGIGSNIIYVTKHGNLIYQHDITVDVPGAVKITSFDCPTISPNGYFVVVLAVSGGNLHILWYCGTLNPMVLPCAEQVMALQGPIGPMGPIGLPGPPGPAGYNEPNFVNWVLLDSKSDASIAWQIHTGDSSLFVDNAGNVLFSNNAARQSATKTLAGAIIIIPNDEDEFVVNQGNTGQWPHSISGRYKLLCNWGANSDHQVMDGATEIKTFPTIAGSDFCQPMAISPNGLYIAQASTNGGTLTIDLYSGV